MRMNRLFIYYTFSIAAVACLSSCDLSDICEEDNDTDGITNCEDVCPFHTDARIIDRNEFNSLNCTCEDTDEDGLIDCLDPCPNHADLTPTICGCDIEPIGEGIYLTCPDIDGIEDKCPNDPNKTAAGVCGCGVSDRMIVWNDDALTIGNPVSECPPSDNIDLCPFDPDKNVPGYCGCGIPETDTDGDTVPDCKDECPDNSEKSYSGTCGCGIADTDQDDDTVIDCMDKCENDPNKVVPGRCGCNVPDTDSDGDHVLDCEDLCPNNPQKTMPDICGCDLEDSEANKLILITTTFPTV